jgi:ABC-type multidrug transport system fused ATPase/permease subunit
MKSLRRSIGIVPQEVELFNDTVIDNLRYGCPHATEEHVKEAASKAEIHAKIMKMENKYESKVGNKGMKLSGGERQRIGIARIFLKDPKIVILDEATSALDTITEKKIQDSLEIANKGRTSLVIAHRLSTICNSDQIMVLDQGQVVEKGSHDELLELDGMYAAMWNQQNEEKVKIEDDNAEEELIEDRPTLLKKIQELQDQVASFKEEPWYQRMEKEAGARRTESI